MQRAAIGFVIGLLIGVVLVVAATQPTYRILTGADMAALQRAVEHDGCEPFQVGGLIFGRCPRLHLP